MARLMKTSRPVWCDENEDVETAAVIDIGGHEYRQTEGHDPQGMRAAGHEQTDGQQGPKNNPDREGAE